MSSETNATVNKDNRRSRVSRGGKQPTTFKKRGGYRNKDDVIKNQHNNEASEEEDIPEGQQCLICAEKIEYAALTPCNHITCHKCTFRQRALYEKNNCLICRSENDTVIITEDTNKEYEEFEDKSQLSFDEKYKIYFTQDYVLKDTLNLLSNQCSICKEQFKNFKDLCDHAKEEHGKYYCLICSKFKKAFKIELPLYTYKLLQKHQSQGDEDGFSGHPECKHCFGKRFYSEDELNIHIREKHERCHICDQTNPKNADYYKNYDSLYQHFTKAHYVCTVASCVEQRFVVFRDDLDLTAHMLKEHGGLSNGQRVVIGSNSQYHNQNNSNGHHHNHHFSQLSTFNNSRWLTSNDDQDEDQQSPAIKKKRFEERARHYLNYDQTKFNEFMKLNESFKLKKINAKELLTIYKNNLFKSQSLEELNFLIKEFSEFFNKNNDLHKDLISILIQENEENSNDQFPILGGRSNANAFSSGGTDNWAQGQSSTGTSLDKFPPLKKPTKIKYINPNDQPTRYTTVLKKKPNSKQQNFPILQSPSPPYIPNYLDNNSSNNTNLKSSKSDGSLISLNSSEPKNGSSISLSSSSSKNIDDNKFPALQKKSNKKIIPRVNEIKLVDPNSWGKESNENNTTILNDGNNLLNGGSSDLDKRKQKLKKKQVLWHT
ncbi:uncharacterized protein KGF55_002822 [Candida pseudojiufengensis]|uniref:uncharacterized protein n=1 Tax=Candida pseudojiufengensis TaxID=497109 RepID=UPI0022248906|nr:uncharacterized protein KGF55_002822 [Candida pseudojiufengensis]KAI5963030.1 hypothetical protein KGF55_002822 [Candida pseudojiufengensis]